MDDQRDFLADLAEELGCPYLSSLREEQFLPHAINLALRTAPGLYSLQQWQEAASYLLRWDGPLENETEARRLLRQFARKNR